MREGTYVLSSPFGPRWGEMHYGLDFAAADGTEILAAADGTVVYIGAASGFGQWIVVDHPAQVGGGTTVYGHMWDAFATGLRVGSKVSAGQVIAFVGANGGSTGPHLHFEVHPTVWRAGSQIDPMGWLPTPPAGQPTPTPDIPAPGQMLWWGIDIASYQRGLDLWQVAAEGFSFVLAKATEGSDYTNPAYYEQRDGARAAGLLFGAYIYVREGDPGAQAHYYASVEPDRGIPVMLDVEIGSGNPDLAGAVASELTALGYRVNLTYLPRWYWDTHLGRPDLSGLAPLMASRYVNGSDVASALYPGDTSPGWEPYGGNHVAILQFSDKGRVAGFSLDVDAFRGTRLELESLFSSRENDMPYTPEQLKTLIFECLQTYVGPIGSDVKDIREHILGGRDKGDEPGLPSLHDLRADKPADEVYHGKLMDYVREIDAKLAALAPQNREQGCHAACTTTSPSVDPKD